MMSINEKLELLLQENYEIGMDLQDIIERNMEYLTTLNIATYHLDELLSDLQDDNLSESNRHEVNEERFYLQKNVESAREYYEKLNVCLNNLVKTLESCHVK